MGFRTQLSLLITVLALSCNAWAKADVKGETLRYLQELRTQNVKRLLEIDSSLSSKIEEPQSGNFEQEIAQLRASKREHALRQEFLDRLIFQVDMKFRDGDLRQFMEVTLVDMAKTDVAAQADSGLWKFLRYAADAVHRIPERKENVLAFLEGYMSRSISNPVRPEEYLASRNYTNGSKSESGSPMKREEAGELADRRLQESQTPVPTRQR